MTENTSGRIHYIDAWRCLAVLMVIQAHVLLFSGVEIPLLTPYSLALDRLSELGVLIFFVISGFVICAGLVKERADTGGVCLAAFYLRRAFRILPPLWLYLTCLLLLSNLGVIKISPTQAATSLLFLCNLPLPDECSWFAGHTWTLAYEEQFYLVFPCLFIGLLNNQPVQRLKQGVLVLMLASCGARLNDLTLCADFMMYFSFMLVGCYAALLPPKTLARWRHLSLVLWLMVLLTLLLCVALLPETIEKYVKTSCYPWLILLAVLGTPMQYRFVARLFNNRVVCHLGKISYTIYLWQELATAYYAPSALANTLSYVTLVFLWAIFSFRYFELPLIKKAAVLSKNLKEKQSLLNASL